MLKKFAGEWSAESECSMGPDAPPIHTTARTSARMIGEFWVVAEIKSTGGGQSVTAIQTIGYDPAKKKYVGTWIDSMFNYMWRYEGTVDETGKILTLEATGPNFMTGEGTAEFRDVYEFKSDDIILARSYARSSSDDEWVQFVKRPVDAKIVRQIAAARVSCWPNNTQSRSNQE